MKAGIITLGCRVNHYESEAVSEELEKLGLEIASPDGDCGVYIVNTCAVTAEAVRKSGQMVRRAAKGKDVFVGVMGCASQLDPETFAGIEGVSFVCGSRNKLEMVSAVGKWLADREYKSVSVSEPDGEIEKMSIDRFDRTRAYVKIQDGCENRCSYCVISKVRGRVVRRDEEDILNEIRTLAGGGCREVVLTGIETAAYGKGLAELIRKTAEIDGIDRIRLGSMEPSFLGRSFADGVKDIPQFMHHIHVSVQSGSSSVLARMRRKYNRDQLIRNLTYLREVMPDMNFTSDIIVGFPGETDGEFEDTLSLVKEVSFLHCHIFKYSKRPGTEAAEMKDQVSPAVKDRRFNLLKAAADGEKRKIFLAAIDVGKPVAVLSETTDGKYIYGHSDGFMECMLESGDFEKGKTVYFLPEHIEGETLCGKEVKI